MSVNALTSSLQSQIEAALSMDIAANPVATSQLVAAAIGSMAAVGKIPSAPSPIPVIPAGVAAGGALIQSALSLGPAAIQTLVAQMMAAGISVIGVNAPPAGLSYLQSQIETALSMGEAANNQTTAKIIGAAVPTYYNMGSVI